MEGVDKTAEDYVHVEGCPLYVKPQEDTEEPTLEERSIQAVASGLSFTVSGTLPQTAVLSVTAMDEAACSYVHSSLLKLEELPQGYTGKAFDIKIIDNGAEYEPAAPVTVTVSGTDTTADSDVKVYHLPGKNADNLYGAAPVMATRSLMSTFALAPSAAPANPEEISPVNTGDSYISFTATSFSIYYIVTGTNSDSISVETGDEFYAMPGSTFTIDGTGWNKSGANNNWVTIEESGDNTLVTVSPSAGTGDVNLTRTYTVEHWLRPDEIVTINITIHIQTRKYVVQQALNAEVYITLLTDPSNGLPSEPGNTSSAFLHLDIGYSLSDASHDEIFADSAVNIINEAIVNSTDLELSFDGTSTIGVVDNTGAKTKALMKNVDWTQFLRAANNWTDYATVWWQQVYRPIFADDGEKISNNNIDLTQYEIIPYVIKYKAQSNRWHIDCAVVKKSNVTLSYDLNIDSDTYQLQDGTDLSLPNSTSGSAPHTATVGSITGLTNNEVDVVDRVSEKLATLTFMGWNTKDDGTGDSYDPGANITISANTTLYAIWEGNIIPGALEITKTVELGEAVDNTVTPPNSEFSFKVELSKDGEALTGSYSYTVTNAEGTQTPTGTVSNGGTIKLKAGEKAQIANLPDGSSYTVTEVDIPEGFTCRQTGSKLSGSISGSTTSTAAFTNVYVPVKAQLTITASGLSSTYEDQGTIYQVTVDAADYGKDVIFYVSIDGNGSKTITDLPYGTYTVTPMNDWSWRYVDQTASTVTPVQNQNGDFEANAQFAYTIDNNKWLSGNAYFVCGSSSN